MHARFSRPPNYTIENIIECGKAPKAKALKASETNTAMAPEILDHWRRHRRHWLHLPLARSDLIRLDCINKEMGHAPVSDGSSGAQIELLFASRR
jgi:hypothetical protein